MEIVKLDLKETEKNNLFRVGQEGGMNFESACPAISMSRSPIGVPLNARDAIIFPADSAAAKSNGRI